MTTLLIYELKILCILQLCYCCLYFLGISDDIIGIILAENL